MATATPTFDVEGQAVNPMTASRSTQMDTSVTLQWSKCAYSVNVEGVPPSPGAKAPLVNKTILHPMSGSASPGEVLAIMGTSGAGKVRDLMLR